MCVGAGVSVWAGTGASGTTPACRHPPTVQGEADKLRTVKHAEASSESKYLQAS